MIAIIDYQAGNIFSVKHAIERLGYSCVITNNATLIKQADKVVFPGVGEAGSSMKILKEKGLDQLIPKLTQPFLGICLGQQLMCRHSEESNVEGLGIFEATVKRFPPEDVVPHMGWNNLRNLSLQLFNGLSEVDDFYFVHSYYCSLSVHTAAVCDYILPFSAAMQKDNFFATQFHPEKSAAAGNIILQNFLRL